MTERIAPTDLRWRQKVLSYFLDNEPVALPTETVYGLAAPIDRPLALARIFAIKERPQFNPLIVHVRKDWKLERWIVWENETQKKLVADFWPGPLSILFKKTELIPDLCTAGSPYVVLRAPTQANFQDLLDFVQVPLAAPSANTSSRTSPTSAHKVYEDLQPKRLAAVVDGGRCEIGLESTIVQVRSGRVEILRAGAITREILTERGYEVASESAAVSATPGSQLKHYATSIPLVLLSDARSWADYRAIQKPVLYIKVLESDAPGLMPTDSEAQVRVLAQGDANQAAYELFEVLREAEKTYLCLVVLKTHASGLGVAINDRLQRAASAHL